MPWVKTENTCLNPLRFKQRFQTAAERSMVFDNSQRLKFPQVIVFESKTARINAF